MKTYTNVKPITQKEQNKEKVTKTKELENSLCQKSVKKSSIYNTNLDLSPPAVCSADELEIIISDKENNLIYDENKNKSNNKYCNKKRTRISNDSNINNEFQQPQPYIPLSQLPISQTIYLENNSISNPKTEQSNKSLYNSNYSNNYLSYFQSYTDEDYSSSNSLYYDSNKNSELSHIQSRKSNQIIPYGAKIRRSFHSNNKNEY